VWRRQVAKVSDLGSNDRTYFARTHLGRVLHPGDHVLCYDVACANLVDPEVDRLLERAFQLPDVVLVSRTGAPTALQSREDVAAAAARAPGCPCNPRALH
jgi:hypothetical protein